MSALICGSIAYDNIMVFQGRFKEHILADQIHILNVSFLVPELRREFGGCAGNIAYNLRLLGGEPRIMATVGSDFGNYRAWLLRHGVNLDHLSEVPGMLTAQAYITTDLDDNQITAFHPGAMNEAHRNTVPGMPATLGIVSPDGRQGMLDHAAQLHAAGIPFIFDPGQGLPMFDGEDLRICRAGHLGGGERLRGQAAHGSHRVERSRRGLAGRGADRHAWRTGLHYLGRAEQMDIPVKPAAILDPTGCGCLSCRPSARHFHGLPWRTRLAALLGSIKIAHRGTQNHQFTPTTLKREFHSALGHEIRL